MVTLDQLSSSPEFIGSFLGAISPVALYFFAKTIKSNNKKVEDLKYLLRLLQVAINDTAEIKKNINSFFDIQLRKYIDQTQQTVPNNNDMVLNSGWMPTFNFFTLPEKTIEIEIYSNFLTNKLLDSYSDSKSIQSSIKDCKTQLEGTIAIYQKLQINNPADSANTSHLLINQLNEFIDTHQANLNIGLKRYITDLAYAYQQTEYLYKYRLLPLRIVNFWIKFKSIKDNEECLKELHKEAVEKMLKDI